MRIASAFSVLAAVPIAREGMQAPSVLSTHDRAGALPHPAGSARRFSTGRRFQRSARETCPGARARQKRPWGKPMGAFPSNPRHTPTAAKPLQSAARPATKPRAARLPHSSGGVLAADPGCFAAALHWRREDSPPPGCRPPQRQSLQLPQSPPGPMSPQRSLPPACSTVTPS